VQNLKKGYPAVGWPTTLARSGGFLKGDSKSGLRRTRVRLGMFEALVEFVFLRVGGRPRLLVRARCRFPRVLISRGPTHEAFLCVAVFEERSFQRNWSTPTEEEEDIPCHASFGTSAILKTLDDTRDLRALDVFETITIIDSLSKSDMADIAVNGLFRSFRRHGCRCLPSTWTAESLSSTKIRGRGASSR
jgi:hypothetical protein